jgi:hypothetical protein
VLFLAGCGGCAGGVQYNRHVLYAEGAEKEVKVACIQRANSEVLDCIPFKDAFLITLKHLSEEEGTQEDKPSNIEL